MLNSSNRICGSPSFRWRHRLPTGQSELMLRGAVLVVAARHAASHSVSRCKNDVQRQAGEDIHAPPGHTTGAPVALL